MRESRSSHEKGFSLIESLIAMAILTISVLGLAQMMGVAIHQSAFSRSSTMAVAVAERQLEDLRALYNDDLANNTTSSKLTETNPHTGTAVTLDPPSGSAMGAVTFDVTWNVDFDAKQKTVTVTVTPQNPNPQQNASVSMTTIFSP